jgi:hypothetical protein
VSKSLSQFSLVIKFFFAGGDPTNWQSDIYHRNRWSPASRGYRLHLYPDDSKGLIQVQLHVRYSVLEECYSDMPFDFVEKAFFYSP